MRTFLANITGLTEHLYVHELLLNSCMLLNHIQQLLMNIHRQLINIPKLIMSTHRHATIKRWDAAAD